MKLMNAIFKYRIFRQVAVEDIKKVYNLFVDEKRSLQYLEEIQEEFMFHEAENEVAGEKIML